MLEEKHCVMDQQFFFIKEEEMDSFRNSLENNPFKTYIGTHKLHQTTCNKSIKNHQFLVQKYTCLCDSYNTLSMEKCENYSTLGTFCERITVNLALQNNQSNADNEDKEEEVEDEWEWEVSESVQMVQPNDIVVIWSDDTFNPYYLIKSLTESGEITDEFCDDYEHNFPAVHTVVKGHYLEVHKRLWYISRKNTTRKNKKYYHYLKWQTLLMKFSLV